jgi:hypothetical protein
VPAGCRDVEHGHCKHAAARNSLGISVLPTDEAAESWCATGALEKAYAETYGETAERRVDMTTLRVEIKKVVAMAAALEREPVKSGEDAVADRAEQRYRIQARFDALLAEACAPGYSGDQITTDPPRFMLVPQEDRDALLAADKAARRLLEQWWRLLIGEEIKEESLLDAMLLGVWTVAGWPPDMIDGPEASTL